MNLKELTTFGLITVFTFLHPVSADDENLYVNIKRLTMEVANTVAMAAVLDCRERGIQATAIVVDKNGIVQAVVRDTLAPPISLVVAKQKAYTSANFSVSTTALEQQSNSALSHVPGLMMGGGGVVIEAGGIIYGAIGVSGAPSGLIDEECANAGIAAVIDDLEMAE